MAQGQRSRSKDGLVQNPGQVGNALAHVLTSENGREIVLGQAWLAAPGKLITCGHVVERFVGAPAHVFVKFPASGNRYQVSRVLLHPSFVRQPDQLVKFDVALMEVALQQPESNATPLPFSYEQTFTNNQTLWALRYPAHLGHLSASPQPLTQDGRYLGPLRIHDTFHLLHDLPLAPGDSGSPISDGTHIVAIHCGDTATLPGLNLPTTSIRLALWVDALRELGISETVRGGAGAQHGSNPLPHAILAFILAAGMAAAAGWFIFAAQAKQAWQYDNPGLMPVKVSFNQPIEEYQPNEDIVITITPYSNCYLFAVSIDKDDNVCALYPQAGQDSSVLQKGEQRLINQFGRTKLAANPSKDMMYLISVDGDSPAGAEIAKQVLSSKDWAPKAEEGQPLVVKGKEFLGRIKALREQHPADIQYYGFIGPHSK